MTLNHNNYSNRNNDNNYRLTKRGRDNHNGINGSNTNDDDNNGDDDDDNNDDNVKFERKIINDYFGRQCNCHETLTSYGSVIKNEKTTYRRRPVHPVNETFCM